MEKMGSFMMPLWGQPAEAKLLLSQKVSSAAAAMNLVLVVPTGAYEEALAQQPSGLNVLHFLLWKGRCSICQGQASFLAGLYLEVNTEGAFSCRSGQHAAHDADADSYCSIKMKNLSGLQVTLSSCEQADTADFPCVHQSRQLHILTPCLVVCRLSIELDSEASSQGADSSSPLKEAAEADDAPTPSTSDPASAQAQADHSQMNGPGHRPRPSVAASPFANTLPADAESMGASPDNHAAFLARHSLLLEQVLSPRLLYIRTVHHAFVADCCKLPNLSHVEV